MILVIGILLMAALPAVRSMLGASSLRGAVSELVNGLAYAADLAATYQRPFGVRAASGSTAFDVFDVRYAGDASAHTNETPPVAAWGVVLHPVDRRWYTVDFRSLSNLEDAVISKAPAAGSVVFHPGGNASSLSNLFVVSAGGETGTVTVNGVTGRISAP